MPWTTSIVEEVLRNIKIIVKIFLVMLMSNVALSTVEITNFQSQNGNVKQYTKTPSKMVWKCLTL